MELEGLVDKKDDTLATSFERLLNKLLDNIVRRPQPKTGWRRKLSEPEVWLVHIIIGDGIGANHSVAKLLWASAATGAFESVRRPATGGFASHRRSTSGTPATVTVSRSLHAICVYKTHAFCFLQCLHVVRCQLPTFIALS